MIDHTTIYPTSRNAPINLRLRWVMCGIWAVAGQAGQDYHSANLTETGIKL